MFIVQDVDTLMFVVVFFDSFGEVLLVLGVDFKEVCVKERLTGISGMLRPFFVLSMELEVCVTFYMLSRLIVELSSCLREP